MVMPYDLVRFGNGSFLGPVLERESYPTKEAALAALLTKTGGYWGWCRQGEC
jgi:hypothetical protein